MSALLLQTAEVNQKLNDHLFKHLPFSYNSEKAEWKHEKSIRKLFPYYFLNTIVSVGLGALKAGIVIPAMTIVPKVFSIQQKITVVCYALVAIPLVGIVELVFFHRGEEMVTVANWSVATKKRYRIPPNFQARKTFGLTMLSETTKLAMGVGPVDWCGLLGSSFFLTIAAASVFFPIGIVYMKVDLWNVLLTLLSSPTTLNLPRVQDYWPVQVLLLVVWIITSTSMFTTCRAVMSCMLPVQQFFLEILNYLCQMKLTHGQLHLYTQVHIVNILLQDVWKILIGGYLGFAFYVLLLFMNVTMLGWDLLPWSLYIFPPIGAFFVITMLLVTFQYCCGFYEISGEMIASWKKQITGTARPREMRRILKSLRPVAIPVADIGIMDKDIKMNYFDNFLTNFVNSLIVARELLS